MKARLAGWTAALEEDLGSADGARVFVPSIMGAGVFVSLLILLADLRRAVAPNVGTARARLLARQRAAVLVAPIAAALDVRVPVPPRPRRRLRTRRFYVILSAAAIALSLYVGIGSTFNYLRSIGPFSGHVAMLVVSLALSTLFFVAAVVSFVVAVRYPVVPRGVRWAVERTPLGVLG